MRPFHPQAKCPLDGIRVLDLSRLVAGNMLSLQLADFGADVIKIEDPGKGDPLRDWRVNGISTHWKVYARNKKSVTLSLRDRDGKDLLMRLVSSAQVFIENFRPGRSRPWAWRRPCCSGTIPGLSSCACRAGVRIGPYRDRPGFGSLVEGMSGFAAKTGYPDRPPVLPPLALADMIAGLYGATAVLVALREVEVHRGKGQVIDLPLLDPIVSILGPEAAIFKLKGKVTPRSGSRSATSSPRNVFETSDGRWISISASIQAMAERVFFAIGRPDMVDDPRFRTNADRVRNAEACETPLRDFIAQRTLADALAVFEQAEVTAAPVYDIEQFLADPHVQAREIVVDLPDTEMGSVPMHAVVPRLSGTPGAIRTPAPALGEHTHEILSSLGLTDDDLAKLRERKVI